PAVAAAAAVALGHIGGDRATEVLQRTLTAPNTPPPVRSATAQGCVLSAEELLAKGDAARAVALYDAVRKADVPRPRVIEATRGAGAPAVRLAAIGVLDRWGDVSVVPVLVDAAAASDDAELAQTARASLIRLPGKDVDAALLDRLRESPARERRVLIELVEQRK